MHVQYKAILYCDSRRKAKENHVSGADARNRKKCCTYENLFFEIALNL